MIIEGTSISVDAFAGRASAYFLSHYHSDHRGGLAPGWSRGPLYAAGPTCTLLERLDGVPANLLRPVEPGETVEVPDGPSRKVAVTAIEANHCPGAVMLHFDAGGRSILYTGDFRIDDAMREAVRRLAPLDLLYVDGTYAEQEGTFPSQAEAVEEVVSLAKAADAAGKDVLIAVYTVGKNRVIEAVSRALGKPVYLPAKTLKVYRLLGYGDFVTGDRSATNVRGYMRGYFESYFWMSPAYKDGSAAVLWERAVYKFITLTRVNVEFLEAPTPPSKP